MPSINVQSPGFDRRDQAEEWMDTYMRAYHPLAYSTHLRITEGNDHKFYVIGSRWSSAD